MSPSPLTASPFWFVDHRDQCPEALRGGIVAIGNFDGMHRGHQALLGEALELGRARRCPVVALTFEPHPRTVFNPAAPVFRLTAPNIKARVAAALGLDGLVVMPFDARLAAMPAPAFIDEILIGALGLEHAVVGWDFHFGHKRTGTPGVLQDEGRQAGFGVTIIEPFVDEAGETVSSSRVRDALMAGALGEANGLLGYRWRVEAEIIHGEKRGRQLGYPTANMRLGADCQLRHGIYAVTVALDGVLHPGVASYGRRPTFDNGAPLLETYLFDFEGDLYGRTGTVAFMARLRDEMRFDGVDALIAQMDRDSAEARAVLAAIGPGGPIDRALDGV